VRFGASFVERVLYNLVVDTTDSQLHRFVNNGVRTYLAMC
jgi:hypothetical protein